ncbi:jg1793 [Pararge aegeria aegeria]|uniref:Jg1793 protein n=1 Tax=Pararge aegeria aegeria TaxID=348720 RepID=A0A8S4RTX9_9NEOP|nr:jg1793 [Pararge aegeria aegeria]
MLIATTRCLCILKMLLLTHAFINEKSKKIFRKPPELDVDALFGFSVAYYTGNSGSLLVGAPQSNRYGKIYAIDVDSGHFTDESAGFENKLKGINLDYDIWLGAAIAVGPNFYVACTPRFNAKMKIIVEGAQKKEVKVPANLGVCFIKQKEVEILKYITKEDRNTNTTDYMQRMDSLGWAINVAPNQKDVLVGGAAMHRGRVIFYQDVKNASVPELIIRTSADQPFKYNFGFGIASGNFFSDQTTYAISTTYGDRGFGKVYFFDASFNHKDTITDDNLSSMFGAVLCTVTLRGPALLVGAPAYAEDDYTHDVGAVHIYAAQTDESNRMELQRTIKGTKSGGFFGHSIINLGDMDDDGNDEIAIAAPYEDDGKGAVYIYSGVGIFDGKFSKRIQPENAKSFGYSLAVIPSDKDINGLAVGAIGSNSVFVYKGIASIVVNVTGSIENLKTGHQTELEIKACVDIKYPKKPVKFNADLQIIIKVTDLLCKLHEDNAPPLKITEKTNTQLCRKNVKASCPADRDWNFVISYDLTAELLEKDNPSHDPFEVFLSERSILRHRAQENWPCEEPDVKLCNPELKVEIHSSIAQPYVVGSSINEKVSLSVLNSGARAYGSCVEVEVRGAAVSRLPRECNIRAGTETVLCKHQQFIQKGEKWVIGDLILQPRTEIAIMKEFYMTVKCIPYNDCKKPNANITFEEKYILKGDTDNINIEGQTNPEGDVDVNAFILLTEGKSFEHLYIIYQDSSYIVCPIEDKRIINNTIQVICNIGDLLKLTETTVIISMEIPPNTLELDENHPNVTVTTTINVMGMNKSLSERTLVKLEEASVPAWVIATASIIALVLILIIAFALYEFGFYKRKTKNKLVALKAEVYRQSIRRSMIRESMRATARRKSSEDIPFLPEDDDRRSDTKMTIDEKLQHQI